jgi:hypothetical protein
MKKYKLVIIITFCIGSIFTSCRPTKNITKAIERKDSTITVISNNDSLEKLKVIWDNVNKNKINYNTFSAKVKVEYEDGKQNVPDVNAFIRIKKDSIIWINVEKFLINVARIYITKDSFFILNKIENEAIIRPISYLQEITGIPFNFNTLQDLLVGNPIFLQEPITIFKQNENTTNIGVIGEIFKHYLTINKLNSTIQHSKLDDVDITKNRTCNITYEEYEPFGNTFFSTKRYIEVSEKSLLKIDLKFKQYNINENLTFPFSIPKSYKKL